MEFIKEYQQLLVGIAGAFMAAMAFVWGLIVRPHEKEMNKLWDVIDDHEDRLRDAASKTDVEKLCSKMDSIRQEVHDAKNLSCAHNSETRLALLEEIRNVESRISGQIMAALGSRRDGG